MAPNDSEQSAPGAAGPGAPEAAATVSSETSSSEPCNRERRAVDERCGLYERLRAQAEAAAAELRETQKTYDGHVRAAERATAAADPRALRAAKEAAQTAFRRARAAATGAEALEIAARDWLREINRVNKAARDAVAKVQRERSAAQSLFTVIERMTVESDASRIRAESALEGCIAARESLAACEEAAVSAMRGSAASAWVLTGGEAAEAEAARGRLAGGGGGQAGVAAAGLVAVPEEEGALPAGVREGPEPAIIGLLRGDRDTMRRLATSLEPGDGASQRRWQLLIGEMIESIVSRAIDASYLIFPEEHAFWGPFTRSQDRAIAAALASLGYRFDGLGGFVDDRIPGYRELSLAVGYAGLDPRRIRHWPTESETAELYQDVSVAAGEYLSEAAGGLTLGEMVSLLGRRADPLADLWNAWGRVRPLLLEPV